MPYPAKIKIGGLHGISEMSNLTKKILNVLIMVLFTAAAIQAASFGDGQSLQNSADVMVSADYDGDGIIDQAYFRPVENNWYIRESKTGNYTVKTFGTAGDILVPADYTGDGKADIAVYRGGTWLVVNSETGETEPFIMGLENGVPAPGDYDNDGQADFAIYRNGTIYVYDSSSPRLRSIKVQSREIRRNLRNAAPKI